MIRVLFEDTNAFVTLICWVYREEMESNVQMERWTMTLRGVCRRMLCHMTLYPYAKAKTNVLNTLDFPG